MTAVADEAGDASEEALEIVEKIAALCDEDDDQIPNEAKTENAHYFEGCADRAEAIATEIKISGYASEAQLRDLKGILRGVESWVH